jgi:hypothetical protein
VSTTNKDARKRQCKNIVQYINTLAYGNDDDPGNYKVAYDTKTGKIAEVKFDDSRAKQLELYLQKIIPKIITVVAKHSSWLQCQLKVSAIIECSDRNKNLRINISLSYSWISAAGMQSGWNSVLGKG